MKINSNEMMENKSNQPENLSRIIIYESAWVNHYLDKVRYPNGYIIEKHHLLAFKKQAVAAIVENDSEEIIFVRVYRYPIGRTNWEIPAGGIEEGETILEAARREVLEETGYETENHSHVYTYYPMDGMANKIFNIVFCKAISKIQDFDVNEVSETCWFSQEDIKQMIRNRSIIDGFTLTALLLWLQKIG